MFPKDWLTDEVAYCSLAAQGLWLRIMFLMHGAEKYGYLMRNGEAMPPAEIARKVGSSLEEYLPLMTELEAAGVPSKTETGIIFSRRMVRDQEKRAKTSRRVQAFRSRNAIGNADVTQIETPLKHACSANGNETVTGKKSESEGIRHKSESEKHRLPGPQTVSEGETVVRVAQAMDAGANDLVDAKRGIFLRLPLKDGEYDVHVKMVEDFEREFPGVDIRQEIRNTRGYWLARQPQQRKSRHEVRQSLRGYLAKKQDGAVLPEGWDEL